MATDNIQSEYTLKWNDYQATMATEFKRLKSSRELTDVKLICQDDEFWVHKVVMAMGSDFLQKVLLTSCCCSNALSTSTSCMPTEIILPDVKSAQLGKILTFVYEGAVNVGEGELGDFFEVAKQLGIKGLVEPDSVKSRPDSILVQALLGNNNDILKNNNQGETKEGSVNGDKTEDECEFDDIMNFSEDESCHSSTSKPAPRPSTSSVLLTSRIRATDPRPCPKCGKIYRSAHTLRTHLEDKHTSCPGYRCVLCGTVAKSRNSLHSHMSRQHRGISTKDLPVLPMPAPFDPQLAARLLGDTYHHQGNNNGVVSSSGRHNEESSTGFPILDTYLQFIAENTSLFKQEQQE